MENFWEGFYKKSEILADWEKESTDEEEKVRHNKKDVRADAIDISQVHSPDTWYRYWP
jgi:hypothetical protein